MAAESEWTSGGGRFPSTIWSRILQAGEGDAEQYRRDMDVLIGRYWKPVYATVRWSWRVDAETARDLTQEFFAYLYERRIVEEAVPDKGRFRNFLKGVLWNFLRARKREEKALKRGGGTRHVSIHAGEEEEIERHLPASGEATPDDVFDREWARSTLMEALRSMENSFRSSGRGEVFDVFQWYYFGLRRKSAETGPRTVHDEMERTEQPEYREVARKMGLSISEVKYHLVEARQEFRRILLGLAGDYVSDPADAEDEVQTLLDSLGGGV